MFSVAVCDDEVIFAEHIAAICNNILKEHFKKEEAFSVHLFSNGYDLIAKHGNSIWYDIIFLDILMDQIDGITVAANIRKKDKNVKIVFLTSSIEFALKGYEVQAYQYLMKSFNESNERKQLEIIMDQIISEKNKGKWFFFKDGTGFRRISTDNILYFEISGRKTAIHTTNGKIILNEKLSEISKQLDKEQFIQCHQSYIVNFKYAVEIQRYKLFLTNEEMIPLSRKYWESVKTAFLKNVSTR
jgi:two-component system response regulator LytT